MLGPRRWLNVPQSPWAPLVRDRTGGRQPRVTSGSAGVIGSRAPCSALSDTGDYHRGKNISFWILRRRYNNYEKQLSYVTENLFLRTCRGFPYDRPLSYFLYLPPALPSLNCAPPQRGTARHSACQPQQTTPRTLPAHWGPGIAVHLFYRSALQWTIEMNASRHLMSTTPQAFPATANQVL